MKYRLGKKSYEKGKREAQLASSSITEIKPISGVGMAQKPNDKLEPCSSQAQVQKKLTFYEPCIENKTVDKNSQVKRLNSRQYASAHHDTNIVVVSDKKEVQQSIDAKERLIRLEA